MDSPGSPRRPRYSIEKVWLSSAQSGPHFRWGTTATSVTIGLSMLLATSLVRPNLVESILGIAFKVVGCAFLCICAVLAIPFLRFNILKLLLLWRGWAYNSRSGTTRAYLAIVGVLGGSSPKLWDLQRALPPLPLPDLSDTLRTYLSTVRPLLNDEEFERTTKVVQEFERNEGPKLQALLKKRAATEESWLLEWWESFIYLRSRLPLPVFSNWYGLDRVDPFLRSQVARAANLTRALLDFKKLLDTEQLPPNRIADTVPLCMFQYSRLFGTTRVPDKEEDYLVTNRNSRHVVVLCGSDVYRLDVYDEHGSLSATDLQVQLTRIVNDYEERAKRGEAPSPDEEAPVPSLTAMPRNDWAEARQNLIEMDPTNAASLEVIESALFCVILDSAEPESLEAMAQAAVHRGGRGIWFDKCFSLFVFKNGRMSMNVDHTWADAGVMVHVFDFIFGAESSVDHWVDVNAERPQLARPKRLEWVLTAEMKGVVKAAYDGVQKMSHMLDLTVLKFQSFGKGFIKKLGMSPDAFCQMAIQLAYYRIHREQALTYESGGTVRFRYGRTETVRSCSMASKRFVEAMMDKESADELKFKLLKTACKNHVAYMRAATNGDGIDRHLFGLRIMAVSTGMPMPKIFEDKAWNLEYKLSSSQTPATITLGGGFAPICESGYGISYVVAEDRLWFHISTYAQYPGTSSQQFQKALAQSLVDMHDVALAIPHVRDMLSKRLFRIQRT